MSSSEINFGERREWVRLYRNQYQAARGFDRLAAYGDQLVDTVKKDARAKIQEAAKIVKTPMPELTGDPLTDAKLFKEFADSQMEQLSDVSQRLKDAPIHASVGMMEYHNAFAAADAEYQAARTALRTRNTEVGMQYEPNDTPGYIDRAIGATFPLAITESWIATRGAIEAYRFVTRQKQPDVTLGAQPPQPWAQDARANIVDDIQHIQVLQVALSPNPLVTAAEFNRSDTLLTVGMPPAPSNDNLRWSQGTWLHDALKHIKTSEPIAEGLLIDRPR